MPRSICSSESRGSIRWRKSRPTCGKASNRAASFPGVKDVRVKGAIGVVELDRIENLNALRQRFIAEGVFIRPFGNIVYLTPALTIAEDDLVKLMDAVRRMLA